MSDPESAVEASNGASLPDDTAKRAGRGGIAIALAKVFFIIVGLGQQIVLKHVLGLQAYGTLGRIQSLGSMVYNPVVQTGVQGVSRSVSGATLDQREATTRTVLSVHMLAVLPLAGAFVALAPRIADLVSAPHLAPGLRLIGGVLLLYGLYAPLVGVLNGHQRFGAQAALDGSFAILRTIGLVAGGYLMAKSGRGAEGSLWGFLGAIVLILMVTAPMAGVGRSGSGGITAREHLRFILPLWAGQLALNFLFQIDLTLLGKFATEAALASGRSAQSGDALAGAYRNAQLFCFLPYQLLLSVTFVLFPMLAQAKRDRNTSAIGAYVARGLRLSIILAGLMVSVTATIPGELLTLVFGADSAALAAGPMRVLALGLGLFALFGILTTVLTSLGRERISAGITIGALVLVAALCFAMVRHQPYGPALLERTALATAIAMVAAAATAAYFVYRETGRLVAPLTILRVALAVGGAILVGGFLPGAGSIATIAHAATLGAFYVVVLVATRELTTADLMLIRTALPGKRPNRD